MVGLSESKNKLLNKYKHKDHTVTDVMLSLGKTFSAFTKLIPALTHKHYGCVK